jgi:hypothetical protein
MKRSDLLPVLVAFATATSAIPVKASTIDLSWEACSPLVTATTVGPGDLRSAYVSVTGQSEPHTTYEVFFAVGGAANTVPDAWRFDAAGCAGATRVAFEWIGTGSKSCPPFASSRTLAIQSYQLGHGSLDVAQTLGMVILAVHYDPMMAPDPDQRYLLARVTFDHEVSVAGASGAGTCGGVETPLGVALMAPRCNWVEAKSAANGAEWPVVRRFAIGNGSLGVNGGSMAVPATATTWGQLKGQYRR